MELDQVIDILNDRIDDFQDYITEENNMYVEALYFDDSEISINYLSGDVQLAVDELKRLSKHVPIQSLSLTYISETMRCCSFH